MHAWIYALIRTWNSQANSQGAFGILLHDGLWELACEFHFVIKCKNSCMHKISSFGLGKQRKIQFFELSRLLWPAPNFLKLWYLVQHTPYFGPIIQTSCLVTCFCAQAVFKLPFTNRVPTQKKIEFWIISVLDVPADVKTLIG